jgi:hypothetical protein
VKPGTDKESAIDHYLLQVGLHNYKTSFGHHPLSLALFLLHKSVRLWYGTESGGIRQQLILGLCSIAVLPLALWQIWRWWRGGSIAAPVLSLTLLYFILLHVSVVAEYRYVQPIFPVLLLAAVEAVQGRPRLSPFVPEVN